MWRLFGLSKVWILIVKGVKISVRLVAIVVHTRVFSNFEKNIRFQSWNNFDLIFKLNHRTSIFLKRDWKPHLKKQKWGPLSKGESFEVERRFNHPSAILTAVNIEMKVVDLENGIFGWIVDFKFQRGSSHFTFTDNYWNNTPSRWFFWTTSLNKNTYLSDIQHTDASRKYGEIT